jgi:hypothetical protein
VSAAIIRFFYKENIMQINAIIEHDQDGFFAYALSLKGGPGGCSGRSLGEHKRGHRAVSGRYWLLILHPKIIKERFVVLEETGRN